MSDSDSDSDDADIENNVKTILATTCPKHITGNNLANLKNQLKAVIATGKYILEYGTEDRKMYDMYEKCREKFCKYYPRHLYQSMHELVCIAIQTPSDLVHYDASRQFGLSKNKLKTYPKKYVQYMQTLEFRCSKCSVTKSGTEFSDGRLIGRNSRRICKSCIMPPPPPSLVGDQPTI